LKKVILISLGGLSKTILTLFLAKVIVGFIIKNISAAFAYVADIASIKKRGQRDGNC